jgi:hypothetical protein
MAKRLVSLFMVFSSGVSVVYGAQDNDADLIQAESAQGS